MSEIKLTRHRAEVMWLVELGDIVGVQGKRWEFRHLHPGGPLTADRLEPLPSATARTVRQLWNAGQIRLSRAGWPHGRRQVRMMLTTAAGRDWAAKQAAPTHRGTTNRNSRGGSADRRRRKQWLLDQFGDGASAPCALKLAGCAEVVSIETISVDRIVPGCEGGTYRRDNIRPACLSCNSKHGAQLGHQRKGT